MPMTRWNYDSDEPASPGLEPVKPRWDPPSPSPPPRTTLNNKEGSTSRTDSSQPSSSHGASRSGRARLKVQPSQGDVVLLNFLAPNRPDIANEAGRHALIPSDDERDSTSEEDEVMSDASQLQQTASDARAAIAGESLAQLPRHHPQQSIPPVTSNPLPPPPSNWRSPPTAPAPMASAVASRPYEPHGAISDGAHLAGRPEYAYPTSSASPAPPTLHKSTSSSSASRDSQRSHPSDIKLPPVSTLLDAANQDPRSSHSSHRTYPESTTSLSPTGPGAYDYVRPSQPYYNTTGRTPQDNSPPGTTNYFAQAGQSPHSAYASYSSGNIQRFPPGSSSSNQPTPASGSTEPYNTPSTHTTPTERQTSASAESVPSAASGPTYGAVPGGFKCTYDGCTAQPFQTQYLLNSHANVHSQNRPHFCPVEGCARAEGGKGFKRKNEMIRHGLVHQSPGYTCPFCPDREHKYPRPDNLQRHVKMHHSDKDKDDSQLRAVLAQRPTGVGSTRGRRRRGT